MAKFKVKSQFRKSDLSLKASSIEAEVHFVNEDTKVYDNVHYPGAFSNKVFQRNMNATHVVFKDKSNNSSWVVNRS
jgi:hypothetical protein